MIGRLSTADVRFDVSIFQDKALTDAHRSTESKGDTVDGPNVRCQIGASRFLIQPCEDQTLNTMENDFILELEDEEIMFVKSDNVSFPHK